jgi:sucrose-6-phosphate hydrolase SacC (GH32 family)
MGELLLNGVVLVKLGAELHLDSWECPDLVKLGAELHLIASV